MPVPVPIFAFSPKVSDFRFVLVNDPTPANYLTGGIYQFDQKLFGESAMPWQLQKQYSIKRTFQDPCTVYVNTQANFEGVPGVYPDLIVIDECGNEVQLLSIPPYIKGAQQIAGNEIVVVNPDTGLPETYQLDAFLWKFTFGDFLTPSTQSGTYFLKMRVQAADSDVYQDYISEPIMVYNVFPNTVLIQGKNLTNRATQNVLADGWSDGLPPTFNHRVEGYPELYSPEGQYVNFLSGDFFNKQLTAQNWRTWKFSLGGMMQGVPYYMVEKISELFITDQWRINNKFFTISATTSEGVKQMWEIKDPKTSGLVWGSIPIRERYMNENVTVVLTPTPSIPLWISPWKNPDITNPSPGDFMPYFLTPFQITTPGTSTTIGHYIFDSEAVEDAFIASFNATYGVTGTLTRIDGVFEYVPGTGEEVSTFPTTLYKYFGARAKLTVGNTRWAAFIARYAATKLGIQWESAATTGNYYTSGTGGLAYTYPAVLSDTFKTPRFYHNDEIDVIAINDILYTSTARNVALSGTFPAKVRIFAVQNCPLFGDTTGGVVTGIDLSPMTILRDLSIRNNALVIGIDSTIFSDLSTPLMQLKNIAFDSNPIASPTNIDDNFNAFVSNAWGGITGGLFDFNCIPAQAPTAASAASRSALNTAGWTVQVD